MVALMVTNHFIDERAMRPEGEPIEYTKPFDGSIQPNGLTAHEISWDEFLAAREEAAQKRRDATLERNDNIEVE